LLKGSIENSAQPKAMEDEIVEIRTEIVSHPEIMAAVYEKTYPNNSTFEGCIDLF